MTSPDVKKCPANLCVLNSTDKPTPVTFLKCGDAFHKVCLEVILINQNRMHQNLHCPMCTHAVNFPLSEIQPRPIFENNALRVKYGIDMSHDLSVYNLAPIKTS